MTLLLSHRRRARRAHRSATVDRGVLLCDCVGDTLCEACALPTGSLLSAAPRSSN